MFRGARLGGPSFEPTIEYDYGALAVGIWANYPMRDKVAGQSDPEIDPYGSYTFELTKELSIQPGFTFYNYPDADKSAGFYKSTFEPSVALNWAPAEGLKLQPKLYQDVVLKQTTLEFNAFDPDDHHRRYGTVGDQPYAVLRAHLRRKTILVSIAL
jgi:hypothetical protein